MSTRPPKNKLDVDRAAWPRRRGLLLIIVLVVVALLTLSTYTFTDMMLAQRASVDLANRRDQADALAASGVDFARWFLMQEEASREELGGDFDNPTLFQAQPVLIGQSPSTRGNFTMIAPALDEYGNLAGTRYGLQDESTRLNLNVVLLADSLIENGGRTLLMSLPGMTEDIADSILDWIDADDDTREFGAEADYYQQLTPPYTAKNGPLDTIEELLLVRGITPQLLFGLDANRNGIVDPQELTSSSTMTAVDPSFSGEATAVDGDPNTAIGWSSYLTLYSQENNINSEGLPRVFLNQDDLEQLQQELSEVFPADWVTFIIAYRQNGEYSGSEEGETGVSGELDLSKPGDTQFGQVLDLIGKRVEVQFEGDDDPVVLASPFADDPLAMGLYLPTLMDNVTVNPAQTIPGRININQAPRTLLAGIPGLSEEVVDQIIQERGIDLDDQAIDENRKHETWILAGGLVTLGEMKLLAPLICAQGDVYRAQVVGYFEDGSASARHEVVIDATGNAPRILSWRKLTHLGRGYPLDLLGIQWTGLQQVQ